MEVEEMKAQAFVDKRPCLEEIDGYLEHKNLEGVKLTGKLKELADNIAAMRRNTPPLGVEPLDADGLKIIEMWRRKLLSGKDIPGPTQMERQFTYVRGKKPVKKKAKMQ